MLELPDQNSATSHNPLLEKLRIPGITVRLPSQGFLYDAGILRGDVINGEVEVYPMTAFDEVIIHTPDKLLSGKAVTEVFARCIPQILDPMNLFVQDVNFLMTVLRQVTFGDIMETTAEHQCSETETHNGKYKLDVGDRIRQTRRLDPTTIQSEYEVTLPNEQHVCMRAMRYGDMVYLNDYTLRYTSDNMSEQDTAEYVHGILTRMIRSVDGITNPVLIKEWVEQISLGWKRILEESMRSRQQWGIDLEIKDKCPKCGADHSFHVTTNPVDFFM